MEPDSPNLMSFERNLRHLILMERNNERIAWIEADCRQWRHRGNVGAPRGLQSLSVIWTVIAKDYLSLKSKSNNLPQLEEPSNMLNSTVLHCTERRVTFFPQTLPVLSAQNFKTNFPPLEGTRRSSDAS